MISYTRTNGTWAEAEAPDDADLSVQIQADDATERAHVRVLTTGIESLHVSGADPRPDTETTHTVGWVPPDGSSGLLFAVHARGNDLIFEDLRSDPSADDSGAALEQVQSSLNEILIPVYIDDVIRDLSERLKGLVLLHTAQYAPDPTSHWTYFRAAGFEHGELVIEVERGEL